MLKKRNQANTICTTCGRPIEYRVISNKELRQTVSESFHIFHATTSLCSILMGFVFTALAILLTDSKEFDVWRQVVVWSLTLTMLCLLFGLLFFHFTAHQVVKYWGIFWPKSSLRDKGGILFGSGITLLLLTLSVLLLSKNQTSLTVLATLVGILGVVHIGLVISKGGLHKDKPYVRDVGGERSADL